MNTFSKTFQLLPKEYKKKSVIFCFLLAIATLLETLGIGLIFPLIDLIVNDKFTKNLFGVDLVSFSNRYEKRDLVFNFLIFYISLIILKSIYLIIFAYWYNRFSQHLYKNLSEKLLKIYTDKNFDFYFKRNSSELLRNVVIECKNVGSMVLQYLKIIVELVFSLSIIAIIFYVNPFIAFITSCIFLFFSIFYFSLVKKVIYKFGLIRQVTSGEKIKTLQETFNGIKDIKLKSLENFFQKIYRESIDRFTTAAYKQNTLIELPKILIELVFLIIVCLIVLLNLLNNSNIEEIIPVLGLYAAVALKLIPSISKFLSFSQNIQSLRPSIDLVSSEMEKEKKFQKDKSKKSSEYIEFKNDISLESVSFNYEGKERIFNNFNLKIKKNLFYGIIGESGRGKSTLIDLIIGILKPNSGTISVDSKNINFALNGWQKKIGYVSQNIFLIDNSIRKNIALGVTDERINEKQIIKCSKESMIYDFIMSLENKFETNIGEKGIKLSGGQIQRLAIARELYRNPEILILDEATSGLDEKTEDEILNLLEKIKGKITVIIVSHRKNTIKNCDEILNLSK